MRVVAQVVLTIMLMAQSAGDDRAAIQTAEAQHHPGARITSVLISGDYALVRATGSIHDGLRRAPGGWRVVCSLDSGAASSSVLRQRCGFPAWATLQLSADELADMAASQGQFTSAIRSERTAYRFAPKSLRESEAARLQLLNRLSDQLRTGQITRPDAIRKWNELRLSVYLP